MAANMPLIPTFIENLPITVVDRVLILNRITSAKKWTAAQEASERDIKTASKNQIWPMNYNDIRPDRFNKCEHRLQSHPVRLKRT